MTPTRRDLWCQRLAWWAAYIILADTAILTAVAATL